LINTTDAPCHGSYFTSKTSLIFLQNSINKVNSLHPTIPIAVDGTYKLLNNGWTLLIACLLVVRYTTDRKCFVQSAIPLMYGFVITESEASYTGLFSSLKYAGNYYNSIYYLITIFYILYLFIIIANIYLGIDNIRVGTGISDHSYPIYNAFNKAFPEAIFLSCYFHLVKNLKNESKSYWSEAKNDIFNLHMCRNNKIFINLLNNIKSKCFSVGYGNMCERFNKLYLTSSLTN
jgi:hypothetical protein